MRFLLAVGANGPKCTGPAYQRAIAWEPRRPIRRFWSERGSRPEWGSRHTLERQLLALAGWCWRSTGSPGRGTRSRRGGRSVTNRDRGKAGCVGRGGIACRVGRSGRAKWSPYVGVEEQAVLRQTTGRSTSDDSGARRISQPTAVAHALSSRSLSTDLTTERPDLRQGRLQVAKPRTDRGGDDININASERRADTPSREAANGRSLSAVEPLKIENRGFSRAELLDFERRQQGADALGLGQQQSAIGFAGRLRIFHAKLLQLGPPGPPSSNFASTFNRSHVVVAEPSELTSQAPPAGHYATEHAEPTNWRALVYQGA